MKQKFEIWSFVRQYEIFIGSLAILLAVGIFSLLFLFPNFSKVRQILQEEKELKEKLANLKKKEATLSSLDFQYYKTNFPKISLILPETKDFVSLFDTFDKLEKKLNVAILRTEFQLGTLSPEARKNTKIDSSAFVIPITITVSGDMLSLEKFIQALSDFSGRYISVKDFSLAKKDNLFVLTLNTNAYFYPSTLNLGPVDLPLPKMTQEQEKIFTQIANLPLLAESEMEFSKSELGKKDLFQ